MKFKNALFVAAIIVASLAVAASARAYPVFYMERDGDQRYTAEWQFETITPNTPQHARSGPVTLGLWDGITLQEGSFGPRLSFFQVDAAGNLGPFTAFAFAQGLSTLFNFQTDGTFTYTAPGESGGGTYGWLDAVSVPAPAGAGLLALGVLFIRKERK
jgi:hypothetical protein